MKKYTVTCLSLIVAIGLIAGCSGSSSSSSLSTKSTAEDREAMNEVNGKDNFKTSVRSSESNSQAQAVGDNVEIDGKTYRITYEEVNGDESFYLYERSISQTQKEELQRSILSNLTLNFDSIINMDGSGEPTSMTGSGLVTYKDGNGDPEVTFTLTNIEGTVENTTITVTYPFSVEIALDAGGSKTYTGVFTQVGSTQDEEESEESEELVEGKDFMRSSLTTTGEDGEKYIAGRIEVYFETDSFKAYYYNDSGELVEAASSQ